MPFFFLPLRKSNNLKVTYIYKDNLLCTAFMEAKMDLRRKPKMENHWNSYDPAKTDSEAIFFLVSNSWGSSIGHNSIWRKHG